VSAGQVCLALALVSRPAEQSGSSSCEPGTRPCFQGIIYARFSFASIKRALGSAGFGPPAQTIYAFPVQQAPESASKRGPVSVARCLWCNREMSTISVSRAALRATSRGGDYPRHPAFRRALPVSATICPARQVHSRGCFPCPFLWSSFINCRTCSSPLGYISPAPAARAWPPTRIPFPPLHMADFRLNSSNPLVDLGRRPHHVSGPDADRPVLDLRQ